MPELPEVETSRRGIEPHTVGYKVKALLVRQWQLRWPIPKELPSLLAGYKLQAVERRGKYLILRFSHGCALIHLGMSGSVRIVNGTEPAAKHDHFDLSFSGGKDGDRVLRYTDPRRFGSLLWAVGDAREHELIRHLGPEPLSDEFNWQYLYQRSRKRKQALKTFIMDSKLVVGVGNIYANEALFSSNIKPIRLAGKLTKAQAECLVDNIKRVLTRAIEQGGTTLKDFVGGDGKPGYFAQELLVYGRGGQPCTKCDTPLKEIRIGQRATVYCTHCQK